MGKLKGFLETGRKDASYRPVDERLKDYKDVQEYLSYEDIQKQASRCMDCGVPFCHAVGCPLHNLIPEWNDLVYKGMWKEAYDRLAVTNALPEITGRVCPALCEASCTLSINDSPVAIKQLELAVAEYAFERGWVRSIIPDKEIKMRIAVIGSGPAGLSAAQHLRRYGYQVTVFEKSDKIGGILRYGIPDFKLEKWIIDRRIKLMEESGIKFETSVNIGEDISFKYLKNSFDAILLATGASHPRDLNIPGRELEGIYFAMDYLTQSNKYVAGSVKDIISAEGKEVLVIGGGDTGSDCVGTANRQGAKNVHQFEILPKPDDWNMSWNPVWPEWPMILRTSSSHHEGVQRDWAVLIKKFTGKENRVEEVHCSRLEWKKTEDNSQPKMVEIPDSDFIIKADMVLLATGFLHAEHTKFLEDMGIVYDEKGNIKTDLNHMTSVEGVFAAGDSDVGASLVVRAITHGQEAAVKIDEYLDNPAH